MPSHQLPICNNLLICDYIHVDSTTEKPTLIGVFSSLKVPKLPTRIQFWIYLELTDGRNEDGELQIRIESSDELMKNEQGEFAPYLFRYQTEHPSEPFTRSIRFEGEFKQYGVYHLELMTANGEPIQTKRFTISGPSSPQSGS